MQQWIKRRTEIPSYPQIWFFRNKFTAMTWSYNGTVLGGHSITLSDLYMFIWEKNFNSNYEYELCSLCFQLRFSLISRCAYAPWADVALTTCLEQNRTSALVCPHTFTDKCKSTLRNADPGVTEAEETRMVKFSPAYNHRLAWVWRDHKNHSYSAMGRDHPLNWVAQAPTAEWTSQRQQKAFWDQNVKSRHWQETFQSMWLLCIISNLYRSI